MDNQKFMWQILVIDFCFAIGDTLGEGISLYLVSLVVDVGG